jgi:hypothetical protein
LRTSAAREGGLYYVLFSGVGEVMMQMSSRMMVKRRWVASVALCGGLFGWLVPRVCSAAPSEQGAAREPIVDDVTAKPSERRWYGEQTFTADGVAGALFLGAIAEHQSTALYGVSGLSFALGAPVIHVVHGHWDLAFASLGLRIAGPLIGGALGSQLDGSRASSNGNGADGDSTKWTTACLALGGLLASAIDGFGLAYDAPSSDVKPIHNQLLEGPSAPQLGLTRHGVSLGFSARF